MALTMPRTAVTMQVNDDGASREIMDDARDEAELKADKAADAIGAAARAAIADTRVRAEAVVTALRAEIDAADGAHAVTKMLGKKGSLSPSGELADALRKPPGTVAIIAEGAQMEAVSLGGFDLDDPVYLSGEFRRGNAVAVCVDVSPEQRLSAKALKDTAQEQQTAMGEFPGPILIIARDDFVDEVQLAQVAADGHRGRAAVPTEWRGADGCADGGGGGAGAGHAGARGRRGGGRGRRAPRRELRLLRRLGRASCG